MKQLDNWVHRSIGPNPLATSKGRDAGTPGGGGGATLATSRGNRTKHGRIPAGIPPSDF